MQHVGIIGLGIMGGPMALNLLKNGFAVTVFNRTPDKCRTLHDAGASVAKSIAELSVKCAAIVIMVSDDRAVRAIVQSEDGILHYAKSGTLVVDSTTVHPQTSREMARALAQRGITYIDAPVTGSRKQAEEASLLFLVGGSERDVRRASPLLQAMGRKHVRLGPIGAGACAKLGNNMLGLIHMAAMAEAYSLVERFGLSLEAFHDIISQSGGRSAMSDLKGPKILKEDWRADFALALAHKDLMLARSLAEGLDHPAPVLSAAERVFANAHEMVGGNDDFCGVFRWYRQHANQQERQSPK